MYIYMYICIYKKHIYICINLTCVKDRTLRGKATKNMYETTYITISKYIKGINIYLYIYIYLHTYIYIYILTYIYI